MHDIVIRGGTIVDGTGKAAFSGDVAIAGGRIAAVGGKLGPAKREIDAAGLMVTPGWVDVHTHYDGQAMWDPLLAPSCWHGVTTVMFGNCGVGFAPVKKEHRGALMDLMEGVEEIPNPVLAAGLNWEWETFPQFMDELERRPRRPAPVDPFPDLLSDDVVSPTYDPAARYAIREGMELALLRAIQELPGRQRAVAGLEVRRLGGQRTVGVGAALEDPADHRERADARR